MVGECGGARYDSVLRWLSSVPSFTCATYFEKRGHNRVSTRGSCNISLILLISQYFSVIFFSNFLGFLHNFSCLKDLINYFHSSRFTTVSLLWYDPRKMQLSVTVNKVSLDIIVDKGIHWIRRFKRKFITMINFVNCVPCD